MAEENNIERIAGVQEADAGAEMTANADAMSEAEFEEYLAGEYGAGDGGQSGDGRGDAVFDDNGQTTEPSAEQDMENVAEDALRQQRQQHGETKRLDAENNEGETHTARRAFKTFETQEEWQSEIDRIIGDRLKNTHKVIDEYDALKHTLSDYYGAKNADEAIRLFREDIDSQMAEREGVNVDVYRRVQNAEQENAQYKRQLEAINEARREEQRQAQARAIQADWEKQAAELKKAVPNFDLKANMQNSEFADYVVDKRLSIADAYYLTRRAEQMTKASQRQERRPIHENGAMQKTSGGSAYTDINKLSDSDFEKYLEKHM